MRQYNRRWRLAALFLSVGASAYAGSVTFTFDTQTINGTTIPGLSSGASINSIVTYMDAVLQASGCSGCTVAVSGANADQTYTGEGYVVGKTGTGQVNSLSHQYTSGHWVTPVTLGDTNGASSNSTTPNSSRDTFLANTSDGSVQSANQITMKFSGLTINGSASVDYEIFPCGAGYENCPSNGVPTMQFEAGTNSNGSDPLVTSFGTNGTQTALTPGSSSPSDGSSTRSQNDATETNAQYIGTWSGSLSSDNELDFIDWPATIGVDNLSISYTPNSPVPEPASIALFGTLVVLLAKKLRKA